MCFRWCLLRSCLVAKGRLQHTQGVMALLRSCLLRHFLPSRCCESCLGPDTSKPHKSQAGRRGGGGGGGGGETSDTTTGAGARGDCGSGTLEDFNTLSAGAGNLGAVILFLGLGGSGGSFLFLRFFEITLAGEVVGVEQLDGMSPPSPSDSIAESSISGFFGRGGGAGRERRGGSGRRVSRSSSRLMDRTTGSEREI